MAGNSISVVQVCSAREAIYGAVQSLMTLARVQREAGTRVEFLTFAGKRFGAQVRAEGFEVQEIRVRGKIDPVAISRMAKMFKRHRYDVVHTHLSTSSVNGALAARLAKVCCVATVHGMSGKMSFAAADHLIAVSSGVKKHLMKQGVRAEKISVVYNGLDHTFLPPSREEARRILDLPQNATLIGTVSRITALKGITDGLTAFAELSKGRPELRYLMVGDGVGLEEAKRTAAGLGIESLVHFMGYREDVSTCLAAMDLFLFPSLKEAMGIALIEAMEVGLPIVSTDVGGIPEVLAPGTGILVKPHRPDELARAAGMLLDDSGRRAELSLAAKLRAQTVFGPAAMEQSTDEVYRRVLGRSPREAPYARSQPAVQPF